MCHASRRRPLPSLSRSRHKTWCGYMFKSVGQHRCCGQLSAAENTSPRFWRFCSENLPSSTIVMTLAQTSLPACALSSLPLPSCKMARSGQFSTRIWLSSKYSSSVATLFLSVLHGGCPVQVSYVYDTAIDMWKARRFLVQGLRSGEEAALCLDCFSGRTSFRFFCQYRITNPVGTPASL